jgi:MFS transporter, OFA family, oxalate/formate antiporter
MPERKGLVTGLILGAFGLGSLIFSFLALAFINPDNANAEIYDGQKLYPPEIAARVPGFFRRLALMWFVIGVCATLLIKRNPNFKEV